MSRVLIKGVNKEIGARLKRLREDNGQKLHTLAKQLAPHVGIQLEGKSGETRLSAIENANANLTLELAIAYSKVFGVSLEYILCLSDDMQPENKAIKEVLGLTDITISKIKSLKDNQELETQLVILNILFESDLMMELIRSFDSFSFANHFYNDCETLDFDCRYENDKEVVRLLPRWRLEKKILVLIDRIAYLLENDEGLKKKFCDWQESDSKE